MTSSVKLKTYSVKSRKGNKSRVGIISEKTPGQALKAANKREKEAEFYGKRAAANQGESYSGRNAEKVSAKTHKVVKTQNPHAPKSVLKKALERGVRVKVPRKMKKEMKKSK